MRILLVLLCLLPAGARSQAYYFPPVTGNEWQRRDPAGLGYDPAAIADLYDYLGAANSKAFILLHRGEIVLERYMNGFGPDSLHYWASAGKTLLSAAIGIAASEDHLRLSDPSSAYLGAGWTDCTPADEARITVLDHLRMTTGLDDTGDFFCTDAECLSCLTAPGTRWAYYNAPFTKLHDVLEAATGQAPTQFIRQRFRAATGLTGAYVPLGPYNEVFFSTARSMARFGLLLLNGGAWEGRQVIPQDYHARMIAPSQQLNPSYGLLTWLNGQSAYMMNGSREVFDGPALPDAPADTYFAAGANGQFINVAPSLDLVWVRVGDEPETGQGEYVGVEFNNAIWAHVNRVLSTAPTSTGDRRAAPDLQVAPNPATWQINLLAGDVPQTVDLYGADGRLLLRTHPDRPAFALPVATLPAGTYRLLCRWADGRYVLRSVGVVR